jgi:hypothetical protein
VHLGYEEGKIKPFEFGGSSRTSDIAKVVARPIQAQSTAVDHAKFSVRYDGQLF